MLSADDVSCSSSQVSAKSEKNMADFDGEESGCEEELVQINSHAELSSHLQQHLPNLASIYHEHLVQGEATPGLGRLGINRFTWMSRFSSPLLCLRRSSCS